MSPRWSPCPRRVFIRRLVRLGFEGPVSGGNHQYMIDTRSGNRIPLFSNRDYSVDQVKRLLRQVERALERSISREEWIGLGK